MWRRGIKKTVRKNPRSMANALPSAQELKGRNQCCGIHGAARERKGLKHAKVTARRRLDKEIIEEALGEIEQLYHPED